MTEVGGVLEGAATWERIFDDNNDGNVMSQSRKNLLPLVIFVLVLCSKITYNNWWHVGIGDRLPDFELPDLAGNTISSHELAGHVVVLNLFATWCGPCRQEMKEMHTQLWPVVEAGDQIVLLSISRGESRETVASFVRERDYSWPFLLDEDQRFFDELAFSGIPRTLVVDGNGIIRFRHLGRKADTVSRVLAEAQGLLQK